MAVCARTRWKLGCHWVNRNKHYYRLETEPSLLGSICSRRNCWVVLNTGQNVLAKQTSHPRTDVWHTTRPTPPWSPSLTPFSLFQAACRARTHSQAHARFTAVISRLLSLSRTLSGCLSVVAAFCPSVTLPLSSRLSVAPRSFPHGFVNAVLSRAPQHAVCRLGVTDAALKGVCLTFPTCQTTFFFFFVSPPKPLLLKNLKLS